MSAAEKTFMMQVIAGVVASVLGALINEQIKKNREGVA